MWTLQCTESDDSFLPIERSQIDLFCSLLLLKRSKLAFQTLYSIFSPKKQHFFGKACIQLTDKRYEENVWFGVKDLIFLNNCSPFFIFISPLNTVKSSWVLIMHIYLQTKIFENFFLSFSLDIVVFTSFI